jgi:anti-anti-sigma factor
MEVLGISVETTGDGPRVRLAGEADLAARTTLVGALAEAARRPGDLLAVDLSALTYIDSSAVHVLVEEVRRRAAAGGRVVITGARPPVRRVFTLLALEELLEPEVTGSTEELLEPVRAALPPTGSLPQALRASARVARARDALAAVVELDRLRVVATSGLSASSAPYESIDTAAETAMTEAARTGRAVWLHDANEWTGRYKDVPISYPPVEAVAALPLDLRPGGRGVLAFSFASEERFDGRQRDLLTRVAELFARELRPCG